MWTYDICNFVLSFTIDYLWLPTWSTSMYLIKNVTFILISIFFGCRLFETRQIAANREMSADEMTFRRIDYSATCPVANWPTIIPNHKLLPGSCGFAPTVCACYANWQTTMNNTNNRESVYHVQIYNTEKRTQWNREIIEQRPLSKTDSSGKLLLNLSVYAFAIKPISLSQVFTSNISVLRYFNFLGSVTNSVTNDRVIGRYIADKDQVLHYGSMRRIGKTVPAGESLSQFCGCAPFETGHRLFVATAAHCLFVRKKTGA